MKYFYLRDNKNFPVACVVSDFVNGTLYAAISNYNRQDQFSRQEARSYARKYLSSGRTILEYDGFIKPEGRKTFETSFVTNSVAAHLTPKEFILACLIHTERGRELSSSAARQAAKRWLRNHKLGHVAWTPKKRRAKWKRWLNRRLRVIGLEWA